MFMGTYAPRLDDKGRIFLPAKFRDELTEDLVVVKGQEHCLYVFSRPEFDRLRARTRQQSMTSRRHRDFDRIFFAGAEDGLVDKQGRITLKPAHRAYAGLERGCAVIGVDNRVEIWDAAAWQRYSTEQEEAYANWSEEVLQPDDSP